MAVCDVLDDRVSIHRPADASGVETMVAHYVRFAFKPHAHEEYVLGLIESGVHDVWCRGVRRAAGCGTVVTMNPGDTHHGGAGGASGWVQRMIYVTETAMRQVVEDADDRFTHRLPRFDEAFRQDDGISSRLATAHGALHRESFKLARDVHLNDLIGVLVGRFASEPLRGSREPGSARLHRARDYLRAHVEDDVTLAQVATVVGLRERQTIDLFNKHFGLPPHAYHLMLKINAVKRLLRAGLPIAECAATFGFVDQSHMTRHFRAMVGTTPKAYAAAV